MYKYEKIFCCEYCEYKTLRYYNLYRHMVVKHIESGELSAKSFAAPKDTLAAPKDTLAAPKDTLAAPKDTLDAPKDTLDAPSRNRCDKCDKILSRHTIFLKHYDKCKGKIEE